VDLDTKYFLRPGMSHTSYDMTQMDEQRDAPEAKNLSFKARGWKIVA